MHLATLILCLYGEPRNGITHKRCLRDRVPHQYTAKGRVTAEFCSSHPWWQFAPPPPVAPGMVPCSCPGPMRPLRPLRVFSSARHLQLRAPYPTGLLMGRLARQASVNQQHSRGSLILSNHYTIFIQAGSVYCIWSRLSQASEGIKRVFVSFVGSAHLATMNRVRPTIDGRIILQSNRT